MRSTVASASATPAGRDRGARACRGRRREAPDAAPRPPRAALAAKGAGDRRGVCGAPLAAAPRRPRDGVGMAVGEAGDVGVPGAAGAHPRQGVAVRRAEDAPRRRAGRTLPAVDALPAARCRGRNPKLRRDRGTAQPRRLAKPLRPPPGSRADAGSVAWGVLRRGPRGGRPQVQEMRARKKPPGAARGRLAMQGCCQGRAEGPPP